MEQLRKELIEWLSEQFVVSSNIGDIRRRLFVPWNSDWNTIVREETAKRENVYPRNLGEVKSVVKDFYKSDKL